MLHDAICPVIRRHPARARQGMLENRWKRRLLLRTTVGISRLDVVIAVGPGCLDLGMTNDASSKQSAMVGESKRGGEQAEISPWRTSDPHRG